MAHDTPATAQGTTVADKPQATSDQTGLSGTGSVNDDLLFRPSADTDLSKPVSELLRTETKTVHDEIHNMPAATALVAGKLAKSEYIRFLFSLWHVYDELERGLYEHRENPVLFHIYHPRVFSRATALSFDICHHLDTVTWQTDPFYIEFYDNIPEPVSAYVERLKYLGRSGAPPEDVALLASHAYVRYLGDLSGGQMMRRNLIKAYELYDDGDGVAFYTFRTLDPSTGDRPANMGEVKRIKEWFKNGLDEAVTDPKTKADIITEANRAFRLNANIFTSVDYNKTLEVEPLVQESKLATTGASLGTLIAVILAVSLTHFGLVLGGFTGAAGGEKLQHVLDWVRGLIASN